MKKTTKSILVISILFFEVNPFCWEDLHEIMMYFININVLQYHTLGQGEDDLQTLAATAIDGQCGDERRFLATIAITLCTLFLFGLSLVEVVQLTKRGWRYFKDPDNYFQLALYILAIIFIVSNDSWCSTHWQWQIGAFAVFLSWINFILILKYIPYTAVPINMFVSICVKFLKMIFLPLLLVLAFGIPFYMVFSTEVSCLGYAMVHILI